MNFDNLKLLKNNDIINLEENSTVIIQEINSNFFSNAYEYIWIGNWSTSLISISNMNIIKNPRQLNINPDVENHEIICRKHHIFTNIFYSQRYKKSQPTFVVLENGKFNYIFHKFKYNIYILPKYKNNLQEYIEIKYLYKIYIKKTHLNHNIILLIADFISITPKIHTNLKNRLFSQI